ncbi:MAG: alpha/beta hydrolase, partial [Bacilli bacterium]|nr:alpha/beta hydrolase [Bacilli bacterium]
MYYLKVNDGAKIAVEDINVNGNKTVVFVHGWPMRKEMFEYQKNILLDKGYRVVSYDIRGFGNSSVPKSGYNYNQLATDLYCVIDNLKVDSVTLVGFSMGGAIATHYMAMYDNYKVSKLILAGAAVPSFDKTINNPYGSSPEQTNQLIQKAYQDRPKLVTEFGNKVFSLNHSDEFKK